jgi:putative endonuclease
MERQYFIYILTTRKNTVLYVGVTSDLAQRIWQHKQGLIEGFTKKYSVNKLVYIEECKTPNEAIYREKCIKRWKRDWKIDLIKTMNPEWIDLYEQSNPIPACAGMTS